MGYSNHTLKRWLSYSPTPNGQTEAPFHIRSSGGQSSGSASVDAGLRWLMSTVSRANGHRTMFSVNLGVRTTGWAGAFHKYNMGSWCLWVFAGSALVSTKKI